MSNSSTTGTPNLKTDGTMIAVGKPGGGEQYKPAGDAGGSPSVHGMVPTGGNQCVKPSTSAGSKEDWASAGGSQSVKA